MTDEVGNLILEHLRAIRSDIADIKRRVGSLEMRMSAMEDQLRGQYTLLADLGARMAHVEEDMRLVKHRLNLVDAE
jgi:predicted  nucleic acid-binding Zn-ribbon protein